MRLAPTTRVDGVAGKRKRFRGGYSLAKLLAGGKTFTRHNSSKNSGKIEFTTRRLFFLSLTRATEGEHAADKRERALYAGWSVWSPQSEHKETYTRARDLKLTRLRTPPTTTNTTPKSRGVICRLDLDFTLVQVRE